MCIIVFNYIISGISMHQYKPLQLKSEMRYYYCFVFILFQISIRQYKPIVYVIALTPAPSQPCRVVFVMSVFTPTLGSPCTRVKIPPPLEPELTDFLWFGWHPLVTFTPTSTRLTGYQYTLTYNREQDKGY